MATQTNGTTSAPDPKDVGNAFIEQYYQVLHHNSQLAHRFYHDISELSRPGPDGQMTSVTTTEGIGEKILSLDYEKHTIKILTADTQRSYMGGVFVLVTGCLIGQDDKKKTFTQSFFLAPQDTGGYFVLNDIFRYTDGESASYISPAEKHEEVKAPQAPLEVPETTHEVDQPAEEEVVHDKEIVDVVENGEDSVDAKETVVNSVNDSSQDHVSSVTAVTSDAQIDAPKKSFASIVSALKQNAAPFQVRAPPANPPAKSIGQLRLSSAPKAAVPIENVSLEKNENQAVKRHSIFVGNLPLDATPAQLESAFKRFGSIKPNGIQVRSSKGSCYGFVEFEAESAMQSALEETSIMIGNRTAHIEEQKKDGGDRVRSSQGRGGFRNDSFRSHGSFSDKKGDFQGRSGGAGRNGGAFQRDYQNGGGRGPRPPPRVRS